MKKNKILLKATIIVMMLFFLMSCKKDEHGNAFFTATIENTVSAVKTAINITSNGGEMNWIQDDRIAIFSSTPTNRYVEFCATPDDNNAKKATFHLANRNESIVPEGSVYYAIYPSEIATSSPDTIALNPTQTYYSDRFEAPMIARSNNNNLAFKNICGVLQLNLTSNKSISRIVINTPNKFITGDFCVDYTSATQPLSPPTEDGGSTVTLSCGTGVYCYPTQSFYIYLPPDEYTSMTIVVYATDGTSWRKNLNTSFHIVRNNFYTLNFVLGPTGAVSGLFSVSSSGTDTAKVWFAKGNLQYNKSQNKWSFMDNQWDIVEQDNQIVGVKYEDQNVVSLFGWGTSGWNTNGWVLESRRVYDTPISTYYRSTYYGPRICTGGTGRNATYNTENDLTGQFAEADWAYHNQVTNGGNAVHIWRTLTSAEWRYILNGRVGAVSKRGLATVNNVKGLIILPDRFKDPVLNTSTVGGGSDGHFVSGGTNYAANIYTIENWMKMESKGAVFLPAAGYRSVSSSNNDHYDMVTYVGAQGQYYTVTHISTNAACKMVFTNSSIDVVSNSNALRSIGCSVRPVQDCRTAD